VPAARGGRVGEGVGGGGEDVVAQPEALGERAAGEVPAAAAHPGAGGVGPVGPEGVVDHVDARGIAARAALGAVLDADAARMGPALGVALETLDADAPAAVAEVVGRAVVPGGGEAGAGLLLEVIPDAPIDDRGAPLEDVVLELDRLVVVEVRVVAGVAVIAGAALGVDVGRETVVGPDADVVARHEVAGRAPADGAGLHRGAGPIAEA